MANNEALNLIEYLNGYEVKSELMSSIRIGKKQKSLILVTKIHTSAPSQVSYIVKYGDESKEFFSIYTAVACYTGL